MRKKIVSLTDKLDGVLLLISALFLLAATILAVANAIVRFARLGNITWAEELNTLLVIILVFLAQPALELNDNQLVIGILQGALKSQNAKRFFVILRGVITMAIIGFLLFYCIRVTGTAAKYNYVTSVLFVPRKYLYGCIIVAFAITLISWLVTIFCRNGNFSQDGVDLGVVDESIIDKQVEDYNRETHSGSETEKGEPKC